MSDVRSSNGENHMGNDASEAQIETSELKAQARRMRMEKIPKLIAEGLTQGEIAQRLGIGSNTVSGMCRELGVFPAKSTPFSPNTRPSGARVEGVRIRRVNHNELMISRVAELSGAGLSARDIASQLRRSQKYVEDMLRVWQWRQKCAVSQSVSP
jgi:transposase